METIEAREFLIKLMGDERVYDSYIETQLAGDFAVKLQQIFEKQQTPSLEPPNTTESKIKTECGGSV